jgi:hypothetical protein
MLAGNSPGRLSMPRQVNKGKCLAHGIVFLRNLLLACLTVIPGAGKSCALAEQERIACDNSLLQCGAACHQIVVNFFNSNWRLLAAVLW